MNGGVFKLLGEVGADESDSSSPTPASECWTYLVML